MSSNAVTCPACNRVLLSRKFGKCNWCDSPIPENLQLSKAVVEKLDKQTQDETEKHEKFMKKPSNVGSSSSSDDFFWGDVIGDLGLNGD